MTPLQNTADSIACAVVGLGKMGIMHTAMISAIPGAHVAALVDHDLKNCRQVGSMGVNAPAFTDLVECLEKIKPRAVWIATPQNSHRKLMEQCLERGAAVFVEKPLAHTLEDARAMLQMARRHPSVPVAVGYMLGHNPLFAMARGLIDEGALGEIKCFRASCRLSQVFSPKKGWTFSREAAGGGVVVNSGVHLLFAMRQLFGRPSGVTARGGGVHNAVEDAMAALFDFPGGLWGSVEIVWSVPGHDTQTHDFEIIGTAGMATVGNEKLRLWLARKGRNHAAGWTEWRRAETEPRAPLTLSPDYCGDEFYLEDADMIDAVREGRAPRVGAAISCEVQEILHALYVSLRGRGEQVEIPREAEA